MATTAEHGDFVLAAIIPNRFDLLDKAILRLSEDHFSEPVQKKIFRLLDRYAELTGAVMPKKYLDDMHSTDAGTLLLILEEYSRLEELTITDAEFTWSVQCLRDAVVAQKTGEVITTSMEILRTGRTTRTGEIERGHEAATEYLINSLSQIEKDYVTIESPEGDIKDEVNEMEQDYADRKAALASGESRGILFGVSSLDKKIGGLQRGDLALAAGYSSDGKSSLCVQLAWSAAVEQGKNVVFFTTETLRPQIRRKILARHSKMDKFGLPEGLNTYDLKAGTLPPEQEAKLQEVIRDLAKNPGHGHIYLVQVPRGATVGSLEMKMHRLQKKFDIDLVIMDYLALLSSTSNFGTMREELSTMLKEAKQIATTFNDGRGVPFVSPWQVSRAARESAEKIGQYTSASLAETAEATNSPDVIVSLFAPIDNTDRYTTVNAQVLKNRDGETATNIEIRIDYATSTFTPASGLAMSSPAPQQSQEMSSFGSLDSIY